MHRRTFMIAAAAALSMPSMAPAQDFLQRQRFTLPAFQIDAHTFEIVEADGAGGRQLWCAAGLYTRKVLGQRGGDIQVQVPLGPSRAMPGRKSVIFTTRPETEAITSISLGVRRAGLTHSMTHAYALCSQNRRLRLRTDSNTLVRY